jgi:hypothetical protein
MKTQRRVSRVVGCMVVACFSSAALGKTLTNADFEGKKICFQDGTIINTFSPGGKVYNNVAGDGTWSIDKTGVMHIRNGLYEGVYRDLGGGSFEYTGSWAGTRKTTATGVYCK